MKLYATAENSKGKVVKIGDNEEIAVTLYHGNKKQYSVYIEYCKVGDIEEPTMDSIITVRDWRAKKGENECDCYTYKAKGYHDIDCNSRKDPRYNSNTDTLRCTHSNCKEIQTVDGEFCEKHYPKAKKQ